MGFSKVYQARSFSSVLLLPEAAAFSEPCPTSSGLAKDRGTASAHHNRLGNAEHGGDPVAAGALDVHEEGVGVLDEPLQLVLPLLFMVQGVQQVLGKRHDHFSLQICNQAV